MMVRFIWNYFMDTFFFSRLLLKLRRSSKLKLISSKLQLRGLARRREEEMEVVEAVREGDGGEEEGGTAPGTGRKRNGGEKEERGEEQPQEQEGKEREMEGNGGEGEREEHSQEQGGKREKWRERTEREGRR